MPSILFVEDDATIAMGVEYSFKQDGFLVSLAYRLEEARDLLKRRPCDLVLLDLGLPDGSGYTLCQEIRSAGATPIIILSARDEEASIVLGLDLGADDYLTKPFRLRELISRMKAVLRRRGPTEAPDRTLACGDVTVFPQRAKVYKNGREVILTALEPLQIPLEIKQQRLVIQGGEGASFTGDLNWSAEALTNVVKNCVEHTPEGGRIEISYGANALYAEIIVSDDGGGIARRDLPNIFNRFYRGENAGENSIGIGLALAKAIFTAQGGDIAVRSRTLCAYRPPHVKCTPQARRDVPNVNKLSRSRSPQRHIPSV